MTKKEYRYRLNILLDEKEAAAEILKKIKQKDTSEFKSVRAYRNRMNREIRELKASYGSAK